MTDRALILIRILRRLPHTRKFDAHLTDCAALGVLYAPFGDAEPLTWRHVLRLDPLPPFIANSPAPDNVVWLRPEAP